MNHDNSLGDGVYFAMDDYAGLVRRFAAIAVDALILFVGGVCLWITIGFVSFQFDPAFDPSGLFFIAWIGFYWMYLTLVKRSRFRTIGYRICGLKIVTTKGERPSLIRMTARMLMWILGPFNLFLDLIWIGADSERQSLRDCYLGTYVVRFDADPIGVAPMHLTRYTAAGWNLAYPRVCRPHDPNDGTA
ncbi:hypothetical protein CKO51_22925 [Rhodopirellula sp. SM50]|nr:RDD family protein [Rhodopirellula sp. SM50]PAY17167.1 hypothetical protein CKO51_22925 [Rhodopirellula sp. SM50]